MAKLYATLTLLTPVVTSTGDSFELNIYRPNFGAAAPIFQNSDPQFRVKAFCKSSVRAVAGGQDTEFDAMTLDAGDAGEIVAALLDMASAGSDPLFEGDGVSHPIVYDLLHPITLDNNGTVLRQIEFSARKMGQIADFLNASGEADSFREFVRSFGSFLGVNLPVTDTIINAFDIEDYARIKEHVMGKLATSRGRLKKAS